MRTSSYRAGSAKFTRPTLHVSAGTGARSAARGSGAGGVPRACSLAPRASLPRASLPRAGWRAGRPPACGRSSARGAVSLSSTARVRDGGAEGGVQAHCTDTAHLLHTRTAAWAAQAKRRAERVPLVDHHRAYEADIGLRRHAHVREPLALKRLSPGARRRASNDGDARLWDLVPPQNTTHGVPAAAARRRPLAANRTLSGWGERQSGSARETESDKIFSGLRCKESEMRWPTGPTTNRPSTTLLDTSRIACSPGAHHIYSSSSPPKALSSRPE